ncbi:hypothetical protein [Vampirovibrio chlorellavorus]|uniref:hypothetical protein n=1 Tax=Vampirovibrio chlorellavorus TaxID=758823 RepID=UPI0026EB2C7F|nr:hypothetical protein [Vampirovibrio chlorellavorus]
MSQPPFQLNVPASNSNPFTKAVKATLPSLATPAVTSSTGSTKRSNPFMTAMNPDSPEFREQYGVNKPLKDAMFLGYRDDQPVFGGNRLFILY